MNKNNANVEINISLTNIILFDLKYFYEIIIDLFFF